MDHSLEYYHRKGLIVKNIIKYINMFYDILIIFILIIYNIRLYNNIKKINNYKKETKYAIKNEQIIFPYISIIIYTFENNMNNLKNLLKSIRYEKNKYEIIIISNKTIKGYKNVMTTNNHNKDIKFALKIIQSSSKYILILNSNMILTSDMIYDMVKFSKINNFDSVKCLSSYSNYKDSIINNIYYHYKYLERMISPNCIFGRLISTKQLNNDLLLSKTQTLQKNHIIQNLPYLSSIPNEIVYGDNIYIIEIFYILMCLFTNSISLYFTLLIVSILYSYYNYCMICYGINDFNILQSIYLTIFKILTFPLIFLHAIKFSSYKYLSYPIIPNKNHIKPELSEKKIFDYGYIYNLNNYNLDIVYVKGSHYQMGLTIGKIYKNQINKYMKLLNTILPPTSINPLWKGNGYTARTILKVIKEYSWKYISDKNKDEISGIADGSKVDFEDYILLSLFPSIFKAHCTILTDENIFLRTLDVELMNDKFVLLIYKPEEGNNYATLTLPGMNWCVTGFSEHLVIGEVFNDYCTISTSKNGSPFYFNFKDILMNCNNISDTKKVIDSLNWHDSIDIAIRSMKTFDLLMIEKRGNKTKIYNNKTFDNYLATYSNSICKSNKIYSFYYNLDLMYSIVNQYSKLNVIDAYHSIIIGLETGSNHSFIIDFNNNKLYISNANEKLYGYQRQLIEFELSSILFI